MILFVLLHSTLPTCSDRDRSKLIRTSKYLYILTLSRSVFQRCTGVVGFLFLEKCIYLHFDGLNYM